MKNSFICFLIILLGCIFLCSYTLKVNTDSSESFPKSYYEKAYFQIKYMLLGDISLSLKNAVIQTESAYLEGQLTKDALDDVIQLYTTISNGLITSGDIVYSEKDRNIAMAQCAVFTFITDSVPIKTIKSVTIHPPFSYNHEDYAGQKDWSNMFVSTLMQTQKGNCHSMPYLYKIIMDELGYESHLALAPNHIYIKANNKKVGCYNLELTCGDFPTDAWYAASGYIHTDAIRNAIYMRALSDKEAVAMTLVDLAQGYQAKFGIGDGSFILQCCNTALEHFPDYINALLLKTEILTALYKEDLNSADKENHL